MTTRPYETTTILDTETESAEVKLKGLRLGAILFPAGFTGATISFQLPNAAGGWAALNGITVTPVLSQWVALTEAQAFAIGDTFKVISASAEAADRQLILAPR